MPISVVTRAYRTSELTNLVSSLKANHEIEKEIIAVCKIQDFNLQSVDSIKLILEDSNRFEARVTGVRHSVYDRVLFLDSDQIPETGLLSELDGRNENMIIIPERSLRHDFVGKCLDDWRARNESLSMREPSPSIPVIPRLFRKEKLMEAINSAQSNMCNFLRAEDSILYYEVYKKTQSIGFSRRHIFNDDPSFLVLMQKAFLYGKHRKEVEKIANQAEYLKLIDEIDRNTLNIGELGIGKGLLIQLCRGIFYEAGRLIGS